HFTFLWALRTLTGRFRSSLMSFQIPRISPSSAGSATQRERSPVAQIPCHVEGHHHFDLRWPTPSRLSPGTDRHTGPSDVAIGRGRTARLHAHRQSVHAGDRNVLVDDEVEGVRARL